MTRVAGTSSRLDSEGNIVYEADIFQAMVGALGTNYVADTAAHTPSEGRVFFALICIEETVIAAMSPTVDGNTLTAVTLPAGTPIYGRFTTVTLTSGSLMAYEGV